MDGCGQTPGTRVMGSLGAGAGNQLPTAAKLPFCFVSTSHHQHRRLQILSKQLQQTKDNNKLEFEARKQRVMSFIHSWAASVVVGNGRGRASHLLRKLAHSVSSSANCHVTRVQRTVGGGSTVWWECSRGACACPQPPRAACLGESQG